MKKLIFLLPLLTLLFATSCSDDNDKGSKKHVVTVTAVLPSDVVGSEITNLSVTVTNKTTSQEVVASIGKDNKATIEVIPGIYSFVVSGSTADLHLNGTESNVEVYADKDVSINLIAGVASTLILKEVYFTGVPDFYFLDSFYEIYNNTDEVQYLDGVILGVIDQGFAVGTSVAQPSQWMPDGKLIDGRYPMTSHVQYFPGTGKDYPIQPRTSIVVAANPIDHSSRVLVDLDVESPVNLTGAQWQLYTNQSPTDTKIEGIPCMEFAWKMWGREMMPATDGQAIIIARLKSGKVSDYISDHGSIRKHPSASPTHLMIPGDCILDAIDIVPFIAGERYKHIEAKDDAGMAWVSGKDGNSNAAYSGKSLRRKVVAFTADQKPIYKDTNNSSNDFVLGGGAPTPGVHPAVID